MTFMQSRYRACNVDGKLTFLTPLETRMLEFLLMQHPDHNIPTNRIIEYLYPNPDLEPDNAAKCIAHYAMSLREKKIGVLGLNKGGGYQVSREYRRK